MGLSGGNLERDLTTIMDIASTHNSNYDYPKILKLSNRQSKWLNEQISINIKKLEIQLVF